MAAAAALALLAGCGSAPDYQYVASSDRTMVLKMPRSWTALKSSSLGATAAPGRWVGFYDSSERPGPGDFFNELPISAPDAPVAQLLSVKIDPGTPILEDDLRNMFAPNTDHELQKFATQALINDTKLVGYQKLLESEVETKTAFGVRIVSGYVFEKDPGKDRLAAAGIITADGKQPTVILDKLALIAKDHKHLHVIAVWCSAECFQKNQKQIADVVNSFTVKLQP